MKITQEVKNSLESDKKGENITQNEENHSSLVDFPALPLKVLAYSLHPISL